jgi:hypothetical protein
MSNNHAHSSNESVKILPYTETSNHHTNGSTSQTLDAHSIQLSEQQRIQLTEFCQFKPGDQVHLQLIWPVPKKKSPFTAIQYRAARRQFTGQTTEDIPYGFTGVFDGQNIRDCRYYSDKPLGYRTGRYSKLQRGTAGFLNDLQQGGNAYIRPSLLSGNKARDLQEARVLFADFDDIPMDEAIALINQLSDKLGVKAGILRSRRGPHGYWPLTAAITEPLEFTNWQIRLAHHLGSDSVIIDAGRLMAWAGSDKWALRATDYPDCPELYPTRLEIIQRPQGLLDLTSDVVNQVLPPLTTREKKQQHTPTLTPEEMVQRYPVNSEGRELVKVLKILMALNTTLRPEAVRFPIDIIDNDTALKPNEPPVEHYRIWLKTLMALNHQDVRLWPLADAWSKRGRNYDAGTWKTWTSFRDHPDPIKIGTLFRIAYTISEEDEQQIKKYDQVIRDLTPADEIQIIQAMGYSDDLTAAAVQCVEMGVGYE